MTRILSGVVVSLLILSMVGQVARLYYGHGLLWGFVPLFYLDREANIPTYYSSMALLYAAVLLGMISAVKKRQNAPYRFHWLFLALGFLYLSIDEIAMIHEWPIFPLRAALHTSGLLYYAWVIPGLAVVALVGLAYLRFIFHLPARIRNLTIVAGAVFVAGALGVEMLSGLEASRYGEDNMTYVLIISLEEVCEMMGIVIFIRALMEYLESLPAVFSLSTGPRT